MPALFDAHCHLQHPQTMDNIVSVIAQARSAGIEQFMCCGTGEHDWEHVAYLAANVRGIHASFGLHPRLVDVRNEIWSEKLVDFLVRFPAAGIGEIGLDFSAFTSTHKDQERVFSGQLQMARQLQRPVTIWCMYAWDALLAILEKTGPLPAGGVVRGYIGEPDLVPRLEALGLYFSFTNWICPPHAQETRRAIPLISPERLLIESDTQHTVIPGQPGRINSPTVLPDICRTLAQVRGMTEDEVTHLTCENARRLFRGIGQ